MKKQNDSAPGKQKFTSVRKFSATGIAKLLFRNVSPSSIFCFAAAFCSLYSTRYYCQCTVIRIAWQHLLGAFKMIKLSAVIVCFNEEDIIRQTLEALQGLADEVVVVDSFSTDSTPDIVREFGAKLFQEEWAGYVAQKNSALQKCSGEWILALDADEVLTPELQSSIRAAISPTASNAEAKHIDGYFINRRTFYMGRLLQHAWQPDRKLRLVRRAAKPVWHGYDPHDSLRIESAASSLLQGDITHYSYNSFADHMQKSTAHAHKAAESYLKAGKKSSLAAILFKPWFVFFRRFILRGAFLDGVPGLIAAFSSATYVYMKYAFLWEMQQQGKRK